MSTATYDEALRLAQQLTHEEQDELIEELEDIRAYQEVKARMNAGEEELLTLDEVTAHIEAERGR